MPCLLLTGCRHGDTECSELWPLEQRFVHISEKVMWLWYQNEIVQANKRTKYNISTTSPNLILVIIICVYVYYIILYHTHIYIYIYIYTYIYIYISFHFLSLTLLPLSSHRPPPPPPPSLSIYIYIYNTPSALLLGRPLSTIGGSYGRESKSGQYLRMSFSWQEFTADSTSEFRKCHKKIIVREWFNLIIS